MGDHDGKVGIVEAFDEDGDPMVRLDGEAGLVPDFARNFRKASTLKMFTCFLKMFVLVGLGQLKVILVNA